MASFEASFSDEDDEWGFASAQKDDTPWKNFVDDILPPITSDLKIKVTSPKKVPPPPYEGKTEWPQSEKYRKIVDFFLSQT